ncbi:MAG: spondin domain-containing protein [Chitinophagales bacterium]
MKNTFFLFIIIILFSNCKKDKVNIFNEVYDVEFVGLWSAASHPEDYPSGAHFSPIVAYSHKASLNAIGFGLSATEGVQSMAETGNTDALVKEIEDFRALNIALDKAVGTTINATESTTVQVGVESGKHTVTVFSMIAPSPDWFVAASTSLLDSDDGLWYDYVEVSAQVFDAGTDSAKTFSAANMPNDPKEAVKLITNGPLTNGSDSIVTMAKFIFRRVK